MAMPTKELEDALVSNPGQVLVIAGAGVACASDPSNQCAYWSGLLKHGVQRCIERCLNLPPGWDVTTNQIIKEGTAFSLIMAASRIEQELRQIHDGQFGSWLTDSVGQLRVRDDRVIRSLLSWGCRLATINYDNLFEEASRLSPVTWLQPDLALRVLRGNFQGILHLHGHFMNPSSVVFAARSYEQICRDSAAQNTLRACFTLGTVVFVGCGGTVSDPNFSGLWAFCREALRTCQHSHFHLVRDSDLATISTQYAGLPIRPLSYGADYASLGPFLTDIGSRVGERRQPLSASNALRRSQTDYDSALHDLRRRQKELSASEYVRQTFEIARALWQAGGHRTAAHAMDQVLMSPAAELPVDQRITYGLEAAEFLLEDGLDSLAARRLGGIAKLLSGPHSTSPEDLGHFRRLFAQALSARAEVDQALSAIETALPFVSSDDRRRLEAERAELHLLSGDLDKVQEPSQTGDIP